MSAGKYNVRFAWAVHSYDGTTAEGDPVSEYADPVNIWGGYDTDRAGTIVASLESDQQSTSASIRFRNYPAVAPLDTLTDAQTGEVWTVDTVVRGANEIRADVYR